MLHRGSKLLTSRLCRTVICKSNLAANDSESEGFFLSTQKEHQWGQTYTFDKMWIIDRSLLTLEKYDLNILRKTMLS